MTLKTRKPTGRAGWPKILVEGGDKAGKSWSLALLSASPKVGRTVVLALGEDESRWDEYGLIPGVRFDIALHDGTWPSIMAAVEDAKEEAAQAHAAGEKPFVFGFDTVTAEWEGLKDWASFRARNSKKNRKLLEEDPDAEIDVTANYWNDARRRHRALMRHLLTFPGIVVLIARGSEVALFQNGQPVLGKKTWSVEAEKNLAYDVSTHIRLSREARPLLVSASGVHCQIRPGIDPPRRLPDDWSLESVIFETLKLDATTAAVGGFTEMKPDSMTPEMIRDEALQSTTGFERIRELYAEGKRLRYDDVTLMNETGDEELLLAMLIRIGNERRAAAVPRRPAVVQPASERPAAVQPAAVQPAADQSAGDQPAGDQPAGDQPAGDQPAGDQSAGEQSAGEQPAGDPSSVDEDAEVAWVADFMGRLGESTKPIDFSARLREITKAAAGHVITPDMANDLSGRVGNRKNEVGKAAA